MSILVHVGITFMTALGAGLASTEDSRVPVISNILWAIAGFGIIVAIIALGFLVSRWTKPASYVYAGVWVVLIICYWVGWLINAGSDWSRPLGWIALEAFVPLISVAFGLYGFARDASAPFEDHRH